MEDTKFCLQSKNNSLQVSECDVAENNQIWIIDQNGEIRNKGMDTCLEADKEKLMLSACPSDNDKFEEKHVFVYNKFHKTIITAGLNGKFGAITYNMEIKKYLQASAPFGFNQWILKQL